MHIYTTTSQLHHTHTYKKAATWAYNSTNYEIKDIAFELGIGDSIEILVKKEAFITIKKILKSNTASNLKCELIGSLKSEIDQVNQQLIRKIDNFWSHPPTWHQQGHNVV